MGQHVTGTQPGTGTAQARSTGCSGQIADNVETEVTAPSPAQCSRHAHSAHYEAFQERREKMQIEHIAIWAQNLETLKHFYETYFGANSGTRYLNEKKQFQSYFLTFASGARLELMQRPDVPHLGKQPGQEFIGYAHLAIAVGSQAAVDALTTQLVEAGYQLLDGPRLTGDGYYESVILDPEGNRVELTA
jgi:lactoylglutathione lyase